MDIRQLKHLVALVELGTVHAAAENQSISQPGLSGSIKRLEDQLGTTLFEREGRGMNVNDKGRDFYRHAKHILSQLRLAKADLNGTQSTVNIGIGEIRPKILAGLLTNQLLSEFPNLTLNFIESHYEDFYKQLERGEVDIAFVALLAGSAPTTLTAKNFFHSPWSVFCAADHPLTNRQGSSISIDELASFKWIRNASSPSHTPFLPRINGERGLENLGINFVDAHSNQLVVELIMHTKGLAYGPELFLETELGEGKVAKLDLQLPRVDATIAGVRHNNTHSAVVDRAFAIVENYFVQQNSPSRPLSGI